MEGAILESKTFENGDYHYLLWFSGRSDAKGSFVPSKIVFETSGAGASSRETRAGAAVVHGVYVARRVSSHQAEKFIWIAARFQNRKNG
jgi:hypothetical protein